jgi:hypothetical protein
MVITAGTLTILGSSSGIMAVVIAKDYVTATEYSNLTIFSIFPLSLPAVVTAFLFLLMVLLNAIQSHSSMMNSSDYLSVSQNDLDASQCINATVSDDEDDGDGEYDGPIGGDVDVIVDGARKYVMGFEVEKSGAFVGVKLGNLPYLEKGVRVIDLTTSDESHLTIQRRFSFSIRFYCILNLSLKHSGSSSL